MTTYSVVALSQLANLKSADGSALIVATSGDSVLRIIIAISRYFAFFIFHRCYQLHLGANKASVNKVSKTVYKLGVFWLSA